MAGKGAGEYSFTPRVALRIIKAIIREAVMIEHELGNWKDFIEDMLRK